MSCEYIPEKRLYRDHATGQRFDSKWATCQPANLQLFPDLPHHSLSPKMSTLSPSASACSVQNTQVSPTPSTFHPCCIPPLYQTLTDASHSPLSNHPGSLLKCTSPSRLTATGYLLITKSKDFHFFHLPRNVSSYLTLLDKALLLINPHQVATLALSCPKLRCPRLALTPLPAPATI